MKSLREALLNRKKNIDVTRLAQTVAEEYINTNYIIKGKLTFENVRGVCIVNCEGGVEVKNKNIVKLTDGFVQGEVKGKFDYSKCKNLESLEGAPEYVGEDFNYIRCENLKSLEGAQK